MMQTIQRKNKIRCLAIFQAGNPQKNIKGQILAALKRNCKKTYDQTIKTVKEELDFIYDDRSENIQNRQILKIKNLNWYAIRDEKRIQQRYVILILLHETKNQDQQIENLLQELVNLQQVQKINDTLPENNRLTLLNSIDFETLERKYIQLVSGNETDEDIDQQQQLYPSQQSQQQQQQPQQQQQQQFNQQIQPQQSNRGQQQQIQQLDIAQYKNNFDSLTHIQPNIVKKQVVNQNNNNQALQNVKVYPAQVLNDQPQVQQQENNQNNQPQIILYEIETSINSINRVYEEKNNRQNENSSKSDSFILYTIIMTFLVFVSSGALVIFK